jgi:uncharacterized protein YjaZ
MNSRINIKFHLMGADRALSPYLPEIKRITAPAIKRIKSILPFEESVDVVVYSYRTTDKNFAVSGYTPTANMVWVFMDPSQKNFRKLLREQFLKVLGHELHHAVRWQGPGYGANLPDALVTEGLAAHFEEEFTKKKASKFYVQFKPKIIERLLAKARKEFKNKSYNHNDWFFGNDKLKIPRHAGYALGYYLTAPAAKKKKPSLLVKTRSGQILKDMI